MPAFYPRVRLKEAVPSAGRHGRLRPPLPPCTPRAGEPNGRTDQDDRTGDRQLEALDLAEQRLDRVAEQVAEGGDGDSPRRCTDGVEWEEQQRPGAAGAEHERRDGPEAVEEAKAEDHRPLVAAQQIKDAHGPLLPARMVRKCPHSLTPSDEEEQLVAAKA